MTISCFKHFNTKDSKKKEVHNREQKKALINAENLRPTDIFNSFDMISQHNQR